MEWADATRKIGVRANADVPRDALQARKFGAEGIGLCRTEHMFFAAERLPLVQQMILFAPIAKRLRGELARLEADAAAGSGADKEAWEARLKGKRAELAGPQAKLDEALDRILPFQRDDFYGLLKAMAGLPVTIRTLDPPLHEFLPSREELLVDIARMEERKEGGAVLQEKRPSCRLESSTSSIRCSVIAAVVSGSPTRRSPRCRRVRFWRRPAA
jgi:pyruvate,orthophosphate dikinase